MTEARHKGARRSLRVARAMTGGLRGTLLGAIVASTAALVLALVLLEDPLVEYRETLRARQQLEETAELALAALAAGEEPDRVADRIGAVTASRVWVIRSDGTVEGDTAADGAELASAPPITEAPDVAAARTDGSGWEIRSDELGETLHATAEPALFVSKRRPEDPTVVRVARPMTVATAARKTVRELLVVGGIIAVILAALLALVVSTTVVRPVTELTRTADAFAAGDFSVRVHGDRRDELGTLGRAFDRMADELAERLGAVRAEEARLRTVLDGMTEAVFVTDRDGEIVLTNRALEKISRGESRGQSAVDAIKSRELHEAVWGAMRGEAGTVEIEVDVAGERRTLKATVTPLPERAGVVAVLYDVTELKRADRVRRDFAANASHELRTPLTAIRGFVETLQDGAIDDPATARKFLATIMKHAERLQNLTEDLLSLSHAESLDKNLELSPLALQPILAEVIDGLASRAQDRRIRLLLELPADLPEALANERAVDQIFVNLVDNAIKYTQEGGVVTVRGRAEAQAVVIEISDNGPGIPPGKLPRVFERFYRIDKGRSRAMGGTGLGLAIVKHLVQRMNADVSVESPLGQGTTFRLRLPRAA